MLAFLTYVLRFASLEGSQSPLDFQKLHTMLLDKDRQQDNDPSWSDPITNSDSPSS
jgi:hypothetical protein